MIGNTTLLFLRSEFSNLENGSIVPLPRMVATL